MPNSKQFPPEWTNPKVHVPIIGDTKCQITIEFDTNPQLKEQQIRCHVSKFIPIPLLISVFAQIIDSNAKAMIQATAEISKSIEKEAEKKDAYVP